MLEVGAALKKRGWEGRGWLLYATVLWERPNRFSREGIPEEG